MASDARFQRWESLGLFESNHWRLLALFCIGVVISNFATGMFAAMVVVFQGQFRFTAAEVGGLISINLAAGAAVSPVITWSVLKPLRIKLMGLGFLFAAAFSVLGALANSYTSLAFAQLGIGAGGTLVSVYGPPLLTIVAPATSRTKYVGAFFLAAPIGNAAGLLLGGAIAEIDRLDQTWRYNFWSLSAAIGIVSFLFGAIRLHPNAEDKRCATPIEHKPFFKQVRIVFGHPLFVLMLFASVATLLPVFICFALAGFIIAAYGSFLPQYVQRVYKQNVQDAATLVGIVIAPAVLIGIITSSLVADWIVKDVEDIRVRYKRRCALLVGVISLGLPVVGIVWFMPKLWLFLLVLAIGLILVFWIPSPAILASLDILNASEGTHAMGWINFFYSSIGAIPGPLVLGALLDKLWDRPRLAFFICGIAVALIWAALVIAYLLAFLLHNKWFTVEKHAHNMDEVVAEVKTSEEGS